MNLILNMHDTAYKRMGQLYGELAGVAVEGNLLKTLGFVNMNT